MAESREVSVTVPLLARVEGEGALDLSIRDGEIDKLRLRIFEPPRFFEKFLEGRDYHEVPDMVARICGICPVAYQMSAVHALEKIFRMDPGRWVREMRRLLYCGEWIQSHALHIHLLAAPDFLGFGSAPEMAGKYPDEVVRGLKLQGLGNELMRLVGGRSVHPIGTRVGGFHHAPDPKDVAAMAAKLREALSDAEALIGWTASLDIPEDRQRFTSVALRHPDEFAFCEGRLVSDNGLDIEIGQYEQRFEELHVAHSTALHSLYDGKPYLVGPLARVNLNAYQLPDSTRDLLDGTGIRFPSDNMFHSIVARSVELHYALLEAIRILDAYEVPDSPYIEATPRAGVGYGCTEAPRGILWHRYETDSRGRIRSARIVPPTSQNQARIEEDLRLSLTNLGLESDDDALRLRGEMVIRNYDPCISCSVHFLKLNVDRG